MRFDLKNDVRCRNGPSSRWPEDAHERNSAQSTGIQRTSGKILRVAGSVTVRDLPSGAPLFKLEDGEAVRVVATDGNWARIETSNGDDGWVRVR